MATKIRLSRRGSKHHPVYWIVVADSRKPRDGAFVEKIGTYNPFNSVQKKVELNSDRVEYWLSVGATPSDRVATLLDKLAIRKKSQRYNPQKAVPKAKSAERAAASAENKTPVSILEPDEDDVNRAMKLFRL